MSTSSQPAHITLVRTPACHFCHDAVETLADLAADHPLTVTTVEADSDRGRVLIAEHRPAMAPLILLDGEYFSAGRLPRKKLAKALAGRAASIRAGA